MQAIGCIGMRACDGNNCRVGIATQRSDLRARLAVEDAAERLARFLEASVELMGVLARECGHSHLSHFSAEDLTTFDREMHHLPGGVGGLVRAYGAAAAATPCSGGGPIWSRRTGDESSQGVLRR